jgi:hypothetical protein
MKTSILAAVALTAAALSLAACEENEPQKLNPGIGQSSRPSASAQPSPVPGGTDRTSVCAAYDKAQGEAEAKLIVVLPKVGEAMGDPSKAGPALTELKAVVASFDASLSAQADLARDADLKAAIQADVSALRKASGDLTAAGNDVDKALAALQTDAFKAVGEKVKALCGK